jgi:hypothetical protein
MLMFIQRTKADKEIQINNNNNNNDNNGKVKLFLQQAVQLHSVETGGGSYISYTNNLQKAVRLSALHTSCHLPPGRFLVPISDPRAIVHLEGLGQLKNPMTSSGIKIVTF